MKVGLILTRTGFKQAANFFTTYSFVFIVGCIFITYVRLVSKPTTKIPSALHFAVTFPCRCSAAKPSPDEPDGDEPGNEMLRISGLSWKAARAHSASRQPGCCLECRSPLTYGNSLLT